MSSVSRQFSVVLSVLSRLQDSDHLTFPCTHSPVRSLTRDSAVSHLLTPNSSDRILMYTYSSSFFFNLNLPHTHTTYLISSVLQQHHTLHSIPILILILIQSHLYIRNTEICSHGKFLFFSFFFFLFSVLFVSSCLVSSLLVSLFRFILSHAYYLTSFVVPSRNVDLAWTFFLFIL